MSNYTIAGLNIYMGKNKQKVQGVAYEKSQFMDLLFYAICSEILNYHEDVRVSQVHLFICGPYKVTRPPKTDILITSGRRRFASLEDFLRDLRV